MHHGDPILIPAETIYTIYISDQRLQTLIRHTDNQLQIHLSGIFQTDCAPLLIHFGKRLIQQYQLNFGIPLTLLHIQHGKSSKQCYILWILSLTTGIPARHIIDKVFPDHISMFIGYLFKHAE